MILNYQILNFKLINSKNSTLSVHQKDVNCPFEIKRIFYIYDFLNDSIRGDHANLNSEFIFIALNGNCEILIDDGQTKQKIILNDKTKGLYIDKMIWKQMYNFSKDCILLVLTNTYYDEKEYIYDYKYFCELKNNMGRRGGML